MDDPYAECKCRNLMKCHHTFLAEISVATVPKLFNHGLDSFKIAG